MQLPASGSCPEEGGKSFGGRRKELLRKQLLRKQARAARKQEGALEEAGKSFEGA